jgi:hypothetical protein
VLLGPADLLRCHSVRAVSTSSIQYAPVVERSTITRWPGGLSPNVNGRAFSTMIFGCSFRGNDATLTKKARGCASPNARLATDIHQCHCGALLTRGRP